MFLVWMIYSILAIHAITHFLDLQLSISGERY